MVRVMKTMYETSRTGTNALGGWLAVWVVALALIAAMPQTGTAQMNSEPGAGVYYEHGSSNYHYQDLSGTHSVPVRGLRPVHNG